MRLATSSLLLLVPLVTACSSRADLGNSQQPQNGPPADAGPLFDSYFTSVPPWPDSTLVTTLPTGIGLAHGRGSLFWIDAVNAQIMTMPDDASTPATAFAPAPTNLRADAGWLVGDDIGLAYLVEDPAGARSLVLQPFDGARTIVATRSSGDPAFTQLAIAGNAIVAGSPADLTAFPRDGGAPIVLAHAGTDGTSTRCPLGTIATAGAEVYFTWGADDPRFGCPVAPALYGTWIAHVPVTGGTPSFVEHSNGFELGTVDATSVYAGRAGGRVEALDLVANNGVTRLVATARIPDAGIRPMTIVNDVLYWGAFNGTHDPYASEVGCVSLATGAHSSITGAGAVWRLVSHGSAIDFRASCPAANRDAITCPPDELRRMPACVP